MTDVLTPDLETGPWDRALTKLEQWDPAWAAACKTVSTSPWKSGVLSRKLVELISLAINVACTNLNADGTRRHIRAVLDAARRSSSRKRRLRAPRQSPRRRSPRGPSTR